MIDKAALENFIDEQLAGTDCFLVELTISSDNEIKVEIDSMTPIDIDQCIKLTRQIEQKFDRDVEDYELEVGSSGLTSPLRTEKQYIKNIGNILDIVTTTGKKLQGRLSTASAEQITLETEVKVKKEGKKRPEIEKQTLTLPYSEIKKAVYHLEF